METRVGVPLTQRLKQRGDPDAAEGSRDLFAKPPDPPSRALWRKCGGNRAAVLLVLLLLICALGVVELVNQKFRFEPLYANYEEVTKSCSPTFGMPEALRLGGIVSYFTQEGGSVGLSSLWPRIANATRANHQAFATLAGVPYKQITWGHRRCGKMRAVAEALKCIPPGAWLFFIDADAAFRAQTEPCTARDPLSPAPMHCDALPWHENGTDARGLGTARCATAVKAMASFHATIFRDRHRDPSLLNMWPFGLFAIRHDAFGLDWLERLASRLESELLLCRLSSIPERKAAYWVTTDSDKCKIWPNDIHFARHFLHLTSGTDENVKESEDATEAFLGMVEQETARLRALGAA